MIFVVHLILGRKKVGTWSFFMNRQDAENYLKEVARSDFEGTQTVGLSIHCISLDSAYKITREYHPGIDFRFVPNFNEVKELLVKDWPSDILLRMNNNNLRFRTEMLTISILKKIG